MAKDNDDSFVIKIVVKAVSLLVIYGIAAVLGLEPLDIPNYPVEVASPLILDYDPTPEAVDFSLITTKDGMKHFCFEIETNSGLIYYDATNKCYINNSDIETIEKYEQEIKEEVPTIKGMGSRKKLEEVALSLMEEYSQKVLVKK